MTKTYKDKITTDKHGNTITMRYCKYVSASAAIAAILQLRRFGWTVSNKYPTADHRVVAKRDH